MRIKRAYLASTYCATAMMIAGLGASSASATPTITPEFTINPNALSTAAFPISGYSPQVESDIHGSSDATVTQTSSTTQTETGWFKADKFEDNGTDSSFLDTGLFNGPYIGSPFKGTYGLYLVFTDTVSGLSGSGANQTGIVTSFEFALKADIGGNDIFDNPINPATPGSTTVTDTGGDDITLAVGSLVAGSAGFQASTGGPTFNTISSFILCNGTAGFGTLGGTTVAASNGQGVCGNFDATTFFTKPVPFFSADLDSATSGSSSDVHATDTNGNPLPGGVFAITGVGADINFVGKAPEPISISLFGAGLMGLAGFGARRRKSVLA